nr:ATP synthase F0 subunit 8 [Macrodiprion sp. 2 GYN-2022c]
MPQMYPMNWLFLFFYTIMMFSHLMIFFYFEKKNYFKKFINIKKMKKNYLIWKW